jgi:hypothetical protein
MNKTDDAKATDEMRNAALREIADAACTRVILGFPLEGEIAWLRQAAARFTDRADLIEMIYVARLKRIHEQRSKN